MTADKAAMLSLPPVAPLTGWQQSARLARDHYVRLNAASKWGSRTVA